jgi:PAS domain S-box-containing protein
MDKPAILVVDDDQFIRSLLQSSLEEEYEVSLHENGEAGIQAMEKAVLAKRPFCLAILDVNLPSMNGLDVARQLRKMDDRLYIVMITGGLDATLDQFEGSLSRNTVLFLKPFSVSEITLITRYYSRTWDRDRELELRTLEVKEESSQRKKSQALSDAIIQTALDCIITINQEGKILEWNPAAENTFGYSREEVLGKTMSETIVPLHFRDAHSAGMKRYLDTRVSKILRQRIEIVALHKDGHEFPIELAIAPLEFGEETIFTAYLRDISQQKEAERQTMLQTQTLEAAANAIIITNIQGEVIWCNAAFLSLTGYDLDDVIGKSTRLFKSGKHDNEFYKNMWETVKQGSVWQGELKNKRKDGSIYVEDMTITPVTNPEGDIVNFIAIKQDVSERIELNEQLVRNERNQRIMSYFATSLLGSNTLEEILWDITYNCISELEWEDAVVYLFNEERNFLIQRAAYGSDKAKDYEILNPIRIALGDGIVGTVAASGISEIVPDLSEDPRYIVDDKSRASELAVPIIYENQVLGVIDSEHSQTGFFQDEDREILEAIASLSANKLVRVLSIQKTEESERKYRNIFESIQDVYAEINFPSGELSEVSPSIETFSGYKRSELIGKPFSEFVALYGFHDSR